MPAYPGIYVADGGGMFPHTVTLYETREDGPARITLLKGVLLKAPRAVGMDRNGLNGADAPRLYVPFSVEAVDGLTGKPKAFTDRVKMENAQDKAGLWTFPLDGGGFFVKGKAVEPDLDRQEIEAKYDGVYSITGVTAWDYGALRHWLVEGA